MSRRLIVSTVIIVILVIATLIALPEVVRRIAINRMQSILEVPVSIEDIDLNLFIGKGRIENLVIAGKGPRPILKLPEVVIGFSPWTLLTGRINLQSITLQNPAVFVERVKPDTYNILEAVRFPEEAQLDANGGFAFTIDRLETQGGEIVFTDRTQEPDYEVTFSSLTLHAGPISTLGVARLTPTDFSAGFRIANGSVTFTGSSSRLVDSSKIQLSAKIAGVELEAFAVYLPYAGKLNLEKSLLNGEARYVLVQENEKTTSHYLDATVRTGGMGLLGARDSQPIVRLAGLAAEDIRVDFLQRRAAIHSLAIEEPYLTFRRDSAGNNLQQLFPPTGEIVAEHGDPNDRQDARMSLVIRRAEAQGGTVEILDTVVKPNVKSVLADLTLAATDVQGSPNFGIRHLVAETKMGNSAIRVTGALGAEPFSGRLTLDAKRLPFQPFRGYLDQLFPSARSSGESIDGRLKLAFEPANGGEFVTTIGGNIRGRNMAMTLPDEEGPFLTTQWLAVDLGTIRLGPNPRVDIHAIDFAGAMLRVVRDPDGSLNITRLWTSGEKRHRDAPENESDRSMNEGATPVGVRLVTVEEGEMQIIDQSVSPDYNTRLSRLTGRLSDLRRTARRAELELQGILGDSAKLNLSGWFTPFKEKPGMQLHGVIRSYALPPLNPYATEFVSHTIEKGEVTMEVDYTVKDGTVEADADIALGQVRLGEKTGDEFTRRIGIPLELAVALLQDIHGIIRLQLEMRGGAGPQVDIAGLIWRAVRNAVVRAITAPFRLVGTILTVGGKIGGIQIEPILFEAGMRETLPEGAKQIEELAELLGEKPKLELELRGIISRSDVDAIRENKFWKAIRAVEGGKDYEEALIRLYQEFGGTLPMRAPLDALAEKSLEDFVLSRIEIPEEELRKLARNRAEIVRRELETRGIDSERLSAAQELGKEGQAGVTVKIVS